MPRRHVLGTAVLAVAAASLAALAPADSGAVDAPTISPTVTIGTAGDNGWYVTSITVKFVITGETMSSGCDTVTLTNEGIDSSLKCTASGPGGSATSQPIYKIDKTPPVVSGTADRAPNAADWFNAPVSVGFHGTDATSGIASCTQASYAGPDNSSATVGGTCRDLAGNVGSGGLAIKYDATAPTVTSTPQRAPDANGWYNHALAIGFTGADATSGLDSCTSTTFKGPDTAAGSVPGNCTDKAGNTGAGTFAIKYDSSAPKLAHLSVTPGNGTALLRWKASADTAAITVLRAAARKGAKAKLVWRGKGDSASDRKLQNGVRYRYIVRGVDQAGNVAEATTVAVPLALSSPEQGARVKAPPLLKWAAVAKASYYNVQLFRGAQKVLSIWPAGTSLKLSRSWSYDGRDFKLTPGRYRWYVWPGVGPRPESRYLKLLGGSFFVVAR